MAERLGAGTFLGRTSIRAASGALQVQEAAYGAGMRLAAHEHERAHLCFVLEGSYEEAVEGRTRSRAPLDLIWYPAGAVHAEHHRGAGRHLLIELAGELVLPLMEGGLPIDVRARRSPELVATARQVVLELRRCEDTGGLALEALVAELLSGLCSNRRPRGGGEPVWMARVDERLRASYREGVPLRELARLAGVDHAHLARTWKRLRGRTLGDELRRLRLMEACRRLASERTPLATIALETGFADQSHLGRALRRSQGTTPARFRRELGGRGT